MTKYHYNEHLATKPVRFIEQCCDGMEDPFILMPFQIEEIIKPAYGWVDENDNLKHRFNYIEMPKGNGKSGLLTWLGVYAFRGMGIKDAEVYCCAADKDQAKIVFDDCRKVVERSPWLSERCTIFKDSIVDYKTGSRLKVISAEAYTKHGLRPTCIIIDEIAIQPNSELYDVLTNGLMKRDNSQCWMITTAGYKSTFGEQMSIRARQIKAGIIPSDYWHVVHYGADPNDDPFDPDVWIKSNPAWGTLIKMENFLPKVEEAKSMPTSLSAFKRLNLNMWTGVNEDWIPSASWDECNKWKVEDEELKTVEWYGGLDMSTARDLSAFAMVGKLRGRVMLMAWHWVPEDTVMDRIRLENNAYKEWTESGWMTATPGNVQDKEWIANDILEIIMKYNVKNVGFDRAYANEVIAKLIEEKIKCDPIAQGPISLGRPTKEFEALVVSGRLENFANPVLRWQVSNVQIVRDRNDNYLISKGKSRDRIDGIAATINAIFQMLNDDGQTDGPPEGWMPMFV